MKKIKYVFLSVLLFCPCVLSAQDIQIQVSEHASKVVAESIENKHKHTFYVYGELSISNEACTYIQSFHEYDLSVVRTHAEYRSMIFQNSGCSNVFLIGLSVPIFQKKSMFITLCGLYRYDKTTQWQLSPTYSFNIKNISLEGYADFYGDDTICVFSENKIKLKFNKNFIGVNLECSKLNASLQITPYAMIGFSF